MSSSNGKGVPAYQRIQDVIRRRIEGGKLKPGDVVNSERELARLHRVSLMTARHAPASLEGEGLVERRRGAGTFVAAPKIHFNKLSSYTEQMARRGFSVNSSVLCAENIGVEEEIAARLARSPTSELLKAERIRMAAGEPFALETCYLSEDQFSGSLSAPLERESLFSI